jgi:L-ascorbate metabolism protein UlaG (beta-lactamase superfamily)
VNNTEASKMQRAGSLQRCQAEPSTCGSNASTAAAPSSATTPAATALTYTSYEGNSWRAEFASTGLKVLVDPWLVGNLAFGGLESIYCGTKRIARPETIDIDQLAAETDLILLTMSIDDHAHRPTLQRLPKSLPVVGSPSAAAVARDLGNTTVYEVDHGQEIVVCDGKMKIRATKGALVGPPWSKRENGFVLSETSSTGISLYYEPHADYVASSVAEVGTVDVVVSPPSTQSLLGYQLVKGATDNIPLLKMLRPKVVVPLMNAEFDATGPLNSLLSETGGVESLERQLKETPELKNVKICLPVAGTPMDVAL